MRGIGIRHLRCFVEVARLGSVGQAAEVLAVTQPAVSKTLRELEDRLGARLFERAGRRLRLTDAGRLFQRHAGAALAEIERGVRVLARPSPAGRRLAIGVLPTVAARLMPRAAIAFAAAMPGVTLRISTGPNWLLLGQLRDGDVDLVVGRLAAPAAMAGLVFEQLLVEPVVAVVRPGHPLAAAKAPDLSGFPTILPPPGAIIRPIVEAFFLRHGQEVPRATVETVSSAVGRGIVLGSDAVWFISQGVVADDLEAGALAAVPIEGMPAADPVGLTQRAGQPPVEEAQALAEALRAAAARG